MARRVNGDSGLTDKQEAFVIHYVACLNATEAARRAGYAGDSNVLGVTGYDNLRKPKIRARIDELLTEQQMSSAEILARLADQARGDIVSLLDPATMAIDWKRAEGKTHLIKKIRQTVITGDDKETIITEVEAYDSQAALVHLGKAAGVFQKDNEVSGEVVIRVIRGKTSND